MEITKRHWVAASMVIVIAIVLAFSLSERAKAPVLGGGFDIASSTQDSSVEDITSSTVATAEPFPINAADTLASWDFKGAYAGNATLIKQADDDIAHLTSLLGKGQYDDYDLYNGIANDYSFLGNGRLAYVNYNHSIRTHPSKGLAYVNLAHLMGQLGAKYTAADAYAKAVSVEPGMLGYHVERLTFLTQQFPSDTALIMAAFADASAQFGDTAAMLQIEASWLAERGQYAEAIKVWKTVRMLSQEGRQAAIDVEIARLEAKR